MSATPSEPPPVERPGPVAGPQRLHPFTLVRGIDPRALLQIVPALAAALAIGSDRLPPAPILAFLVATVLVGVAGVRLVAWQRHTYELTGAAVVERRGIISRRERTVQLARLQQIEIERSILDRLVGTAVVRLETASDASEVELELRVVSFEEAHRLRDQLLPHAVGEADDSLPEGRELVHVPLAHVVLASVTGRRLLLIPIAVAGAIGIVDDLGLFTDPEEAATDLLAALGIAALVGLVVVFLLASVALALVVGVLRDGDFRIREVGDDLHVNRGLLATRDAVVPRRRLQMVTIHRGWLRRKLGFASLTLRSAGGGGRPQADGGVGERRLVVPLVPAGDALPLLHALLPDLGALPELRAHPPAARRRARIRYALANLWFVPASLALVYGVWRSWPAATLAAGSVLAAVVPLAWWLGSRDHANRAWAVDDVWVVARGGPLSIAEEVSPRDKAQGTELTTSPFQRRRDLATLTVHVAGPGAALELLDLDALEAAGARDHIDARWALAAEEPPSPGQP